MVSGRTLGSEIRGGRLGYRWVETLGAYLRVADEGATNFLITVAPSDDMPKTVPKRPRSPEHRVWWSGDPETAGEIMAITRRVLCGDARPLRIKRRVSFVLDDYGNFVEWATL